MTQGGEIRLLWLSWPLGGASFPSFSSGGGVPRYPSCSSYREGQPNASFSPLSSELSKFKFQEKRDRLDDNKKLTWQFTRFSLLGKKGHSFSWNSFKIYFAGDTDMSTVGTSSSTFQPCFFHQLDCMRKIEDLVLFDGGWRLASGTGVVSDRKN